MLGLFAKALAALGNLNYWLNHHRLREQHNSEQNPSVCDATDALLHSKS